MTVKELYEKLAEQGLSGPQSGEVVFGQYICMDQQPKKEEYTRSDKEDCLEYPRSSFIVRTIT